MCYTLKGKLPNHGVRNTLIFMFSVKFHKTLYTKQLGEDWQDGSTADTTNK